MLIGGRGALSITSVDAVLPLPGIRESGVRYNKHLLDRYVPDAHGVQVLRSAHLERAHDLSGWDITDLGHGRHLVQAHDLAPWYAQTLPDPDVLAHARADFAGAILTQEIIEANRPPWWAGARRITHCDRTEGLDAHSRTCEARKSSSRTNRSDQPPTSGHAR